MAHVLIGWELGGNRGHAVTVLSVAKALRSSGHRVTIALQRIDALSREAADGFEIWQAPLSPRLLITAPRQNSVSAQSHGDTLAAIGMDDPQIVSAVLRGWSQILNSVKPDAVVADFAPFLLLSSRSTIPTVAIGTGFTLPPSTLPNFPSFTREPALPEEATLDSINFALKKHGKAPLSALPQVYCADEAVVGTFTEIDPYRNLSARALVSPMTPGPMPGEAKTRSEVFVYANSSVDRGAALWSALQKSRLPIRMFTPDLPTSYRNALHARGFAVEEKPLSFSAIASRSRILLSTGSHGFVCSGLLAGIPQVICPNDLEKALTAAAVGHLGVAGVASLRSIETDAFSSSLIEIYDQDDIAHRARKFAEKLRTRANIPFELSVTQAVERVA